MLMIKIIYYFYVYRNINLFFINLCCRGHEKWRNLHDSCHFHSWFQTFLKTESKLSEHPKLKHRFHARNLCFLQIHTKCNEIYRIVDFPSLFISLLFEEKVKNTLIFAKMYPISKFDPNFVSESGLTHPDTSRPSNSGSPEWVLGRVKNRSRLFWNHTGVSRELRFHKIEVFLSENEFPTRNRSFQTSGTQKSCFLRLTSKNGSLFVCFGLNRY